MTTFARTTEYVTETCCHDGCGVQWAFTRAFYELLRGNTNRWWYCPNGHRQHYTGPTEKQKQLNEANARAEQLRASLIAQRDQTAAAKREAAEARASETRLRWRVGNGVCPCCQRTFPALASHVATKHPDFVHTDLDALSTRMRELLATISRETEAQDVAVLDAYEIDAHMGTVRALENRGFIERIDSRRVALTETGWPLARQASGVIE